jgi:hypothetical protein
VEEHPKRARLLRVQYLNIKIFTIMSATNESAKAQSNANANAVVLNTKANANVLSYLERMRDHKRIYTSPSKCIKNAFETSQTDDGTQLQDLYAKAVASVFDIKNSEHTKNALQALLKRYKKNANAPRKGYSEYYVHQYFEKLIDAQKTTNAACYNYRAFQRVAEQESKQ